MDLGALPWRGQFPIAVEVTVPVQPAAKAGFFVGVGEISDVGFIQPMRQGQVGAQITQKSLAVLDEEGIGIGNPAAPNHPPGPAPTPLPPAFATPPPPN